MVWGGSGAASLGLDGEVGVKEWRSVFGAGGARHPESGERLVHCLRPGMELVVSPHKSVAELGVIGRAEDMHAILDAERDATMAYLDEVVREQGGRRGRAQVRTPTDGLTWAVSRHATTRAGDPQVHDHVLVANIVKMGDERGSWKGLDTGLLRDHLHAATAIGRMAAAAKAVELGYGIEADPGPSGRLGGWAIVGIPKEAWEVHATRAAQIDAAVGQDASYRSRAIAARATRDRKSHERVEDLVPRWRDELARAGYSPLELAAAVERAGSPIGRPSSDVVDDVATELLSAGGRLAEDKTFTRRDAIVAVAPYLHGLSVSVLDSAVDSVLSHQLAVPLPPVAGARQPVWAAARVLEDERRIAELADVLSQTAGPRVGEEAAISAVRHVEVSRGFRLTERQAEVAKSLLTSGHALDLVVGVAGSGKTTTLSAVREGFEAAGYHVIGAATSGQAAKALGQGAGVASRTVASLTWRLEHGREPLTPRHVLVLDEGAMSSDADVGKLLTAVEASGAKLVAVGDYRQLGSVGPGGALEALATRHPGHVWALTDNLRQVDAGERHALDHLRAGHLPAALGWYAAHGRVHPAPSREKAMYEMVKAWAYDVADGRDALLVAYHRDAVERLNQAARAVWENLGQLSGPELESPGGRRYRAGDRIITLSPGPDGAWTTSQRAVVTAVDPEQGSLVAATPEGAELRMGPEYFAADKLGHAYATTAHRSQGSTVDVTYALEDGGGRELAYVAMSRARHQSHIHVVAPGVAQAAERLVWAWGQERRQAWAIDRRAGTSLAELYRERAQLARSIPPDRSAELAEARSRLSLAEQDRQDLRHAAGRWAGTPAGQAVLAASRAAIDHQRALEASKSKSLGPWARRKARREVRETGVRFDQAFDAWRAIAEPYEQSLESQCRRLEADVGRVEKAQGVREAFLAQDPTALERLAGLDRAVKAQETVAQRRYFHLHQRDQQHSVQHRHNLGRDPGHGIDL